MNIFVEVLVCIFQEVLVLIIAALISEISYSKKDYIAIIISMVPLVTIYHFLGFKTVIFLIIFVLSLLFIKKRYLGILIGIASFVICYITNLPTVLLQSYATDYTSNILLINLIYIFIFSVISLLLTFIIRFFVKALLASKLSLNKLYLVFIGGTLLGTIIILYIYMPKEFISLGDFKYLAVVHTVFIAVVLILVISISFSITRELQYKRNMKEVQNYYEYTLKIEKINNEMRKFRHDYVNILSTMSEFIREDDMEGLRKYFNEEIVPMQDNMQAKSIKINGLENFHVREIKGLLTTKILQAQEKNIRISIEVPDIIEKINLQTIDLSRIIGIILDNAIEASEQLEDEPLIRVGFIQESESVTFIVMNKCQPDMPRVHTLFEENFSTKGDNRGLGLSTLKEIAEDNENVLLDTTIENGFFIQKVEILDFEP